MLIAIETARIFLIDWVSIMAVAGGTTYRATTKIEPTASKAPTVVMERIKTKT